MEIACNAMEIAAKQTLCEDEASLAAGLEAMEIAIDPMESALGQASLEAGLEAMEIAMDAIESGAKQTLGQDEASLEAGLEAGVEAGLEAIHCHGCDGKWSKTDTWLG